MAEELVSLPALDLGTPDFKKRGPTGGWLPGERYQLVHPIQADGTLLVEQESPPRGERRGSGHLGHRRRRVM